MIKEHFNPAELDSIQRAVRSAEARTDGEIRVVILTDCSGPTREKAIEEFHKHGLANTRDKTGVLIMLVLKRRAIELLADEGIHKLVPNGTWNTVVADMSKNFRRKSFYVGLAKAVYEVGDTLARYVPRTSGHRNELPDEVIVEDETR